jgi:hypothetical protein
VGEWIAVAGEALDAVLSHCEDYPVYGRQRPHAVREYLLRHCIGYDAFYRGHHDRTLPQVRGELALRAVVDRTLDDVKGGDPMVTRRALRGAVGAHDSLGWALAAPARARLAPLRGRDLVGLAVAGGVVASFFWHCLIGLAAVAALAGLAGALYLAIRRAEERDRAGAEAAAAARRIDRAHHGALTFIEDNIAQNQLNHLVDIKPGRLRHLVLWLVLWVVDVRARYWFRDGHLAGIPTIHFAQWSIIDGGRRVLFISNYDGSWESYLGDFIDFAVKGINAIWSNSEGFPPTAGLTREGARQGQAFKAWTREHQVPSQLWYSWYRDLSVANVNRNSIVRRGLAGPASDPPDPAWVNELLA